jgi:hypothetical protein
MPNTSSSSTSDTTLGKSREQALEKRKTDLIENNFRIFIYRQLF